MATNWNAPLRMRYGGLRDLVLATTVALGDGRVIRAGRPVVKNVAGYDMPKVFIGAHGTLGLIADVTLKLAPLPRVRASLIAPLEEVNDRLSRIWSPVSHLNAVLNSEALRAAHDACLPLLSEFQTYVGQHEGLYQAYLALSESDDFPRLDDAQRKEIQNTLRDFRLSGIGLPAEAQQRYGEIALEFGFLASRGSDFHSPEESRLDLGKLPDLPGTLTPVWEALGPRIEGLPQRVPAAAR